MGSATPAAMWKQTDLFCWRPSVTLATPSLWPLMFHLSEPQRDRLIGNRLSQESLGSMNSFFSDSDDPSNLSNFMEPGLLWKPFINSCDSLMLHLKLQFNAV